VLKIIKQLMVKDMTTRALAVACEISYNCAAEWIGKLHTAELIQPVGFAPMRCKGTQAIIWSWNYVE